MAKVKSMPGNNSSGFFVNDASSLSSLLGLNSIEITEESPPKSDFDINEFLSDIESCSEQQYFYSDTWKTTDSKTSPVLSGDVSASSGPEKKGTSSASLGALAADHLKKNATLSELCFGCDFNLTDILSNDNNRPNTNAKNTACENLNLLDLCLRDEDILPNVKSTSKTKNDVFVDDLSDLVDSSHVPIFQSSTSLESLATSHFLTNGESSFEKESFDHFICSLKNGDSAGQASASFDNILLEEKDEYVNNITGMEDLLTELSSTDSSETTDKKQEFSNETSDSEHIPDIDLSFCIKKNVKDKSSLHTLSPESSDSGFDEMGFLPLTFSIPSQKSISCTDTLLSPRDRCPFEKEKLTSTKQSLFSRALAATRKIDDKRKEKLKNIRNNLLNSSLNFMSCNKQKESLISERIFDHSNECTIISSFLKVTDEK